MARSKINPAQASLLDFDTAHARRADPETSHAAAEKVTPDLPHLQQLVLDAIRVYGPLIDRKLVTILRGLHGRTDSTWRTRRAELVGKGLVEACGKVDGHTVWRVKRDG